MLQTILKIIRKNVFPPQKFAKKNLSLSLFRALSLFHTICVCTCTHKSPYPIWYVTRQKLVSNLSFAQLYTMTGANTIPGSNVLYPLKLPANGAASNDEVYIQSLCGSARSEEP